MGARDRKIGHRGQHATEGTSLLHSSRQRTRSLEPTSGESSLTISSLGSSSSGSRFIPWYSDPLEDPECGFPAVEPSPTVHKAKKDGTGSSRIFKVIGILILGVFTANADGSLVLATHSTIASEFGNLQASSWLMTAFALAGASFQNVVRQTVLVNPLAYACLTES